MHIIGLVGGIASGKSAVAAELARLGAVVLDADQAAHEVINSPEVKQMLVERWGAEVLDRTGSVDRGKVAERVFSLESGKNAELRFLEQTLHPRIRQQFETELATLAASGVKAAVIDAPLLVEAGWAPLCDSVVLVDSSREKRLERAAQRNWSEEEFIRREAAQMPIEEKSRRATHTIPNDSSHKALREHVQSFWESVCP